MPVLNFEAEKLLKFDSCLVPCKCSLNNRPDGILYGKCGDFDILEIHSSPYKNFVSRTAANVLYQLRLVRCFHPDVKECVGFTLPKYGEKTCVTKVTVSFKVNQRIHFEISLQRLVIENVKDEITTTLQTVITTIGTNGTINPIKCFMHLSKEELAQVGQVLEATEGNFTQIPSRHSVIFHDDRYVWKYVPRSCERQSATRNCSGCNCCVQFT